MGQLANIQLANDIQEDRGPNEPVNDFILEENDPWFNSFYRDLNDYAEQALATIGTEPISYNEVLNSEEKEQWLLAMKDELEELKRQDTWALTDLPSDRKALKGRWVLKLKQPTNKKPIYKARWVAKGF